MRLSPFAAVVAACVLTLTACGDDGDDPSSKEETSPSASTTDAGGKDSKGKDTKGDEQTPNDGLPGTDVCQTLNVADIEGVFGVDLKGGDFSPGVCRFADPSNPAGASVGISQTALAAAGGIDTLKTSVGVFVNGKPVEVPDVGDAAVVVVGKGPIGDTAISAGAVAIEDNLIQVNVTPGAGVNPKDLEEKTVELLELMVATF